MEGLELQDSTAGNRGWLAGLLTGDSAGDNNHGIDVIFVRGVNQDPRWPLVILGDSKIRPRVFAYSTDAITHGSGLNDLAHQLLLDVQRLRTRKASETDGPIVFVSHDYGGTIVKRAMVMASQSKSFVNLLVDTRALAFLGCPQRCDRAADLEDKFAKLLNGRPDTYAAGVTRLASVMAETTRATNKEFIGASLLARMYVCAMYSDNKDDSLRVFDRADVCFLVPGEARWPTVRGDKELAGVSVDLSHLQHALSKNAQRETLLRMSSPVYPLTTRVTDRSQLESLAGEPSFQMLQQRRAGISVLEVFGHGDVRTAAEYIFSHLDLDGSRSKESDDDTPDMQRKSVQFFQFGSKDTRFSDIGCMLRTVIAQLAKLASQPSTINTIQDRMEELADNSATWTDGELYDLWLHLVRASKDSTELLVLGCFDECDTLSRRWFLSRLSSSIAATELSLKVIMTHNRASSGDELRIDLSNLTSAALYQEPDARQDLTEPKFPVLYSIDLDKIGFTASTSRYERPSTPLAVRNSRRYPQSTNIWPKLKEIPEGQDALAIWVESNRHCAEQMAATLRQQLPSLSFASVCVAILEAIPAERQGWAREVMAWSALTFRPLTVEEAAAAVGLGVLNKPCSGSEFLTALRKHFGGLLHIVHGKVTGGLKLWQTVKSATEAAGTEDPWYIFSEDIHGHWEITKKCLEHLSSRGVQEVLERLDSTTGFWAEDARDETGPDTRLLAYATTNWPVHYQKSRPYLDGLTTSASTCPPDGVTAFLADDKLREPWARAYHRVTHGSAEDIASEKFSPLQICARFGFNHTLRHFSGGAVKEAWQQAAMEAATHGRIDTLRSILAIEPSAVTGVDPDDITRAAISSKNEEVILEVLDKILEPARGDDSPSAWVSNLVLESSRLGFTAVVRKVLDHPLSASYLSAPGILQPLHYAARGDHLEMARLLKDAGANVEGLGTAHDGLEAPPSPLTVACEHGSPCVAKFLLECGAQTDITDGERGWTPLQFAAASGCPLVINSILEHDKLDRYDLDMEHPVALAMARGYWRCVEILCCKAGDFEMMVGSKTLLSHAVENGDVDMARMLLGRGAQLQGQHAKAQEALFHEAVVKNNKQMAALLIKNGADIENETDCWSTPLMEAAGRGLTDMAEYLLEQGAQVDRKDSEGVRPLYRASYEKQAKMVELLLRKGADPEGNITDENDRRPIHVAYDSPEVTKALLRHGADCNAKSNGRYGAPLLTASWFGYLETVRVLLDNDIDGGRNECDLEVEDNKTGSTALTLALGEGNEEIVLALLEAGANVNRTMVNDRVAGSSPLHVAVRRGSEAIVNTMLRCRANVDAKDTAGNTPLNHIQYDTPVKIVQALLRAGADVESTNDDGHTPLWRALRAGNVAVTRMLLGLGVRAKVNITSGGHNSYRTTESFGLLQCACLHAAPELVEAVVRLGGTDVDMDMSDNFFGPPLQAVCHRPTLASARLAGPRTADDITPLAAEIIHLMTILLEKALLGYAINAACLAVPFGVVRFLIRDRGAEVDVRDELAGRTPLHLACYRDARFVDAVLSGLAAQACVSGAELGPMDTAVDPRTTAQEQDEEQPEGGKGVNTAVQEYDAVAVAKLLGTSKDATGRVPLHYAAASGKPDLVRHVLDKLGIAGPEGTAAAGAADQHSVVNSQDAQGWTPLHWTARTGQIWTKNCEGDDSQGGKDYAAVVRLLIDRGADPGAATALGPSLRRSSRKWTPLDVARYHNAPKEVLDALAVPRTAATGTGRTDLRRRTLMSLTPGKERRNVHCDCCFLAAVGTAYLCMGCEDYVLCFTCHGSHEKLHPPPHGLFDDMSFDESSDEEESEEEEDTQGREEEVGAPNEAGRRPASPAGEGQTGDKSGDMPSTPEFDFKWGWGVGADGELVLQDESITVITQPTRGSHWQTHGENDGRER